MSKKKEKKIDLNNLEPGEKLKYGPGAGKRMEIPYIEGNRAHRRDRYEEEKTVRRRQESVKLYKNR